MSDALALIAHDLKNALGGLEAELAQLIDEPTPVMAQRAHLHCAELRRQFVQFLTLYGARTGGLQALCEDESPQDMLQAVQRLWSVKLQMDGSPIQVVLRPTRAEDVPAFWYLDHRLVQLALDAAIHNAVRFARTRVELAYVKWFNTSQCLILLRSEANIQIELWSLLIISMNTLWFRQIFKMLTTCHHSNQVLVQKFSSRVLKTLRFRLERNGQTHE